MRRIRTPTVVQMEAVECGAAALGIMLGYYGRFIPLEELRVSCGVSRNGSKAINVVKAARQYGLEAKGFQFSIDELKQQALPVVVFWNFNHFLVVEGFHKNIVYVNDPAKGPRTVTADEFNKSYTGVTLTMKPGPDFQKGGRPASILASLNRRRRGLEPAITFILLITLMLVIPGIVLPGLIRIFIDDVIGGSQTGWLRPLILGMVTAALGSALLTWLQQSYLLRLETRLALSSSARFFWHVLRLPMEFFTQRFGGEIGFRVGLNDRVAQLLSGQLATAFLNTLMVGLYALLMLMMDWRLALIAIAFGTLNMYALRKVARTRVDINRRLQAERGQLMGTAMGGLQMIETLKASGGEDDFFSRWSGYQANLVDTQQQLSISTQYLSAVPPLLRVVSMGAILSVGGWRVMAGDISIGLLVAFQTLAMSFAQPIERLVDLTASLQEASGDMQRLDDVMNAPLQVGLEDETKDSFSEGLLQGNLVLKDVSFGYSRLDAPLIDGFNLELRPGQRVAVVGGTGSGKSTIARLVCGLVEPWQGEVRVDGKPRPEIPHYLLTRSVSMVDETIFLFEGSVRDNLTLWNSRVTDTQLTMAAQDACILEDIMERPGGLDGPVDEAGANWSGGQRQRLEIARALVGNPTLIILDEATSALDPKTEQRIDENLRRRGCSCLIIAHRLSTVRDCDEIIVLNGGQVVQRGTHDALLQQGGAYAELVASSENVDETSQPTVTGGDSNTGAAVQVNPERAANLIHQLCSRGEPQAAFANHPFSLNQEGAMWIVQSGCVDVFAVHVNAAAPDDNTVGRRHFMYTVPGGGLVLGTPTSDSTQLIGVGLPDTQLVRTPQSVLKALCADDGRRSALAELLDRTVLQLYDALMRQQSARSRTPEEEGTQRTAELLTPVLNLTLEENAVAQVREGVLWIRVEEGSLQLMGDADLTLAGSTDYVPVCDRVWMRANSKSLAQTLGTEALLNLPHPFRGVDILHRFLKQAGERSAQREQTQGLELLKATAEADHRLWEAAQGSLAAVMNPVAAVVRGNAVESPLFAALQALEPALGVTMRRPPQSRATESVLDIAQVSGVRTREVTLGDGWWQNDNLPMIAFDKTDGRPLALVPTPRGATELVDVMNARRQRMTAALAATLKDTAYTLYRPFPTRPLNGWDVVRFAFRGSGGDIKRILLTSLAVGALAIIIPLLTGRLFSSVIPGGAKGELAQIAVALGVVAISTGLLQVAGNIGLARLEARLDASLQAALWDRMMRLPASFFRRFTAGELAMRAMGISTMITLLMGSPLRSMLAGVFSVCSFAVLFLYDTTLALLVGGMALVSLALTAISAWFMLGYQRAIAAAQGRIAGLVLQLITGLAKLRVAAAEPRAFWLWAQQFAEQRRITYGARVFANALIAFQSAWPILATALVFGVYVARDERFLPTAGFLAFFAAFGQLFAGLAQLGMSVIPIMAALPVYERTRPILDAEPEVSDLKAHPGRLRGVVDVRRVSFRYQSDAPLVVDDVSLHVAPGEFVAVVGPSGAGKSSLVRLLLGFEAPLRGAVFYDGQDLSKLNVTAVRHEIGVVLQNGQLMRGTIYQNIIGSSAMSMDEAWEAARMAGIDEEIRRMPMGMLTYVSEGASTFSGGQKQRLLIARAIARHPRIIILDEATSGLDNHSQEIVSESLERLRASRLVIAHRLSTIVRADRIYVLQDGRVVQVGTYNELMAVEGTFQQLARRQLA